MREPVIFHIDVNSAFLSWTALARLEQGDPVDLRTIPSIVGGDTSTRHGVVLAKSIPAKKYGIQTGEPMAMALRKCPNLVVVPSDFRLYTENSLAFKAICRDYAPVVESFSIDEVFLDVTQYLKTYGMTARELASRIATEILEKKPDVDVVAAYQKQRHEGKFMAWCKDHFYRFINRLSEVDLRENASDFRTFRRNIKGSGEE